MLLSRAIAWAGGWSPCCDRNCHSRDPSLARVGLPVPRHCVLDSIDACGYHGMAVGISAIAPTSLAKIFRLAPGPVYPFSLDRLYRFILFPRSFYTENILKNLLVDFGSLISTCYPIASKSSSRSFAVPSSCITQSSLWMTPDALFMRHPDVRIAVVLSKTSIFGSMYSTSA